MQAAFYCSVHYPPLNLQIGGNPGNANFLNLQGLLDLIPHVSTASLGIKAAHSIDYPVIWISYPANIHIPTSIFYFLQKFLPTIHKRQAESSI